MSLSKLSEGFAGHIAIEGNIGSGKSSMCELLYYNLLLKNDREYSLLPEPVKEWTNFGSQNVNMLAQMYEKLPGSSFKFQMAALLTKLEQLDQVRINRLKIVERSIAAQRYVFIPILLEDQTVSTTEFEIMDRMLQYHMAQGKMNPDYYIYLKTDPTVVYNRVQQRGRDEESCVTLQYLTKVHNQYENWFLGLGRVDNVLTLDGNKPLTENIHRAIQFLELKYGL